MSCDNSPSEARSLPRWELCLRCRVFAKVSDSHDARLAVHSMLREHYCNALSVPNCGGHDSIGCGSSAHWRISRVPVLKKYETLYVGRNRNLSVRSVLNLASFKILALFGGKRAFSGIPSNQQASRNVPAVVSLIFPSFLHLHESSLASKFKHRNSTPHSWALDSLNSEELLAPLRCWGRRSSACRGGPARARQSQADFLRAVLLFWEWSFTSGGVALGWEVGHKSNVSSVQ